MPGLDSQKLFEIRNRSLELQNLECEMILSFFRSSEKLVEEIKDFLNGLDSIAEEVSKNLKICSHKLDFFVHKGVLVRV